jgi:hypothetical protein
LAYNLWLDIWLGPLYDLEAFCADGVQELWSKLDSTFYWEEIYFRNQAEGQNWKILRIETSSYPCSMNTCEHQVGLCCSWEILVLVVSLPLEDNEYV